MSDAMSDYEDWQELSQDLDRLLNNIPEHPVEYLRRVLGTPEQKKALASALVPRMLSADADFPTVVTTTVDVGRALQVESGDPGIAHVLMLGLDTVAMSTMSVFWRGLCPKEKLIGWLKRSWKEGLDTTQRSLKLVVGRGMCDSAISAKLFFAGYAGGSSLGAAQTLGAFLFTQLPKELPGDSRTRDAGPAVGSGCTPTARSPGKLPRPGSCPQDATALLQPWLRSIARIRVTWVIYANPMDRTFDALGFAAHARGGGVGPRESGAMGGGG